MGVTEGATATYTVRLTTEPSGAVTVAVTSGTPATATVAPSTLTFTASTWATAQPVTVTGTEDADATTDEQATVTHTPTGASEYTNVAPNARPSVTVTVTDDEMRGVTVSAAADGLGVPEGATATYTVVLTAQPVGGAVTVTVSGTTSTVMVAPTMMTFAATDWATAQTVSVSAAEDDNAAQEEVTLTHGVAGADYGANGVTAGSVTVTVTDNDVAALVIDADPATPAVDAGPLALKELITDPAYKKAYTVKLATQPSGAVTVTVTPPAAVTVDVAAAPGTQQTLTFSPTTWATAQPVTATAQQDDDAGDETGTLAHVGSGADYELVTQTLTVTVADDETPGVTLSGLGTSGLTVPENGTATYMVRLVTRPVGGAVTIRPQLVSGGDASLTLLPAAPVLTFTATTWQTAQAVTVRAADDADPDAGTATLSHSVSGADYGMVSVDPVTVTEADDDAPGIRVTPNRVTVPEATTGFYTIRLHTLPKHAVTVTVTKTSGSPDVTVDTDATPETRTLVFTSTTWNTAQTVRVRAQDDADGTDEEPTTLRHAVSSDDPDYQTGPLPDVDVTVAVTDNDTPGVTVSAVGSAMTVAEGATASYTVVLATLPTEAVTVTVTRTAESSPDVTVGPAATPGTRTLVFTTGDWNTAQTVTVRAAQEDETEGDYRDEEATLTHAVTGYGAVTTAPAVTVTVTDDDKIDPFQPTVGTPERRTINRHSVVVETAVDTAVAVTPSAETDGPH